MFVCLFLCFFVSLFLCFFVCSCFQRRLFVDSLELTPRFQSFILFGQTVSVATHKLGVRSTQVSESHVRSNYLLMAQTFVNLEQAFVSLNRATFFSGRRQPPLRARRGRQPESFQSKCKVQMLNTDPHGNSWLELPTLSTFLLVTLKPRCCFSSTFAVRRCLQGKCLDFATWWLPAIRFLRLSIVLRWSGT